jgi:hypothetical protein
MGHVTRLLAEEGYFGMTKNPKPNKIENLIKKVHALLLQLVQSHKNLQAYLLGWGVGINVGLLVGRGVDGVERGAVGLGVGLLAGMGGKLKGGPLGAGGKPPNCKLRSFSGWEESPNIWSLDSLA